MHRPKLALKRRLLHVAALIAAFALPGCPAFTNGVLKPLGLVSPPTIEMTEAVPQDFEFRLHIVDQTTPAADYLITVRRSGKCDYRVTTRLPKRRVNEGTFDILDNQVNALWKAAREAQFGTMEERWPSEGEGPDKALGVQAFALRAYDLTKEVRTHFQRVPALEGLRGLVIAMLPETAVRDTGPAPAAVGKSKQIVGDLQTKLFYPADDPRLKDVPADRRQPFPTWYDAVNYGFSPASGFDPWERSE